MLKSNKRTIDKTGKLFYDFDFNLERNIYEYLCFSSKKGLKRLNEKVRFETYKQWKQYVCNRYKDYSKSKLIEFSRYLNQRIRNKKPYHEYWSIMLAIILTLAFTKIVDFSLSKLNETTAMASIEGIILSLFIEFLIIGSIVAIIFWTLPTLINNNIDENFLRDYKEIIDEIIKEV